MAKAKEDKPNIKFEFTLQKNICMYLKRNGALVSMEQLNKDFDQEGPLVVLAMLKSLKTKKYVTYDDKNVHLSDDLYYFLQT